MATLAGTQADFFDGIKQIIELDYDAIKAYEAAISRLENPTYVSKLREFMADHQWHVDKLSEFMVQQGLTPPSGPDLKAVLTQGKVIIAALATDVAILRAMKSNESDTNQAYDNISSHPDKPQEISAILLRCREDEHRHFAWLDQEINQSHNENSAPDYPSTGTY